MICSICHQEHPDLWLCQDCGQACCENCCVGDRPPEQKIFCKTCWQRVSTHWEEILGFRKIPWRILVELEHQSRLLKEYQK